MADQLFQTRYVMVVEVPGLPERALYFNTDDSLLLSSSAAFDFVVKEGAETHGFRDKRIVPSGRRYVIPLGAYVTLDQVAYEVTEDANYTVRIERVKETPAS